MMNSKEDSHSFWIERVRQLRETIQNNPLTEPKNVMKHFFLQAVDHEFHFELNTWRAEIKNIINEAIDSMFENTGSIREKAARVLQKTHKPMIKHIRLADIRNRIVFEIYKSKGITIDTYFDRYSNPPGTDKQNEQYIKMAHGSALYTTAKHTQLLSDTLIRIQLLKRIFIVHDIIFNDNPDNTQLNWFTDAWSDDINKNGMGHLIWTLFLDLWTVENDIA